MATKDNLKAAFAGESQANRTYLAFARRAEKDGFPQVAKLFRAAAEAETVHAHAHLRVLKGVGTTAENLKEGMAGESHEFMSMYPAFVAEAEAEGDRAAVATFRNAMEVEEVHHGLYEKALAAVSAGSDLAAGPIFICEVCGNTVEGHPPEKCPICGAPKAKFFEVK